MSRLARPLRVLGSPQVLSLFCGCGSFDLGFRLAGFDIPLAIDLSEQAVASYNRNTGKAFARVGDLSVLDPADIVALLKETGANPVGVIGGAPCQSFSSSNVYVKEDDPRHLLPNKFAGVVKHLNEGDGLQFFVFENVQGITRAKHTQTFGAAKSALEDAGFTLYEWFLDAGHFGVPQNRARVFVVGINRNRYPDLTIEEPLPTHESVPNIEMFLRGLPDATLFRKGLKPEEISHHPNHWTMNPKSLRFSDGRLYQGNAKGRSFRVLSWNKPSWAVAYGHREIHVHPSGKRRLTVFEAMRLQGLPDWFVLHGNLSQQVRQISDAVPAQVGLAIARQLLKSLWALDTRQEHK